MSKVTTAQLHALLVQLTERVNELTEQNVALAQRSVEAHSRIDHAGEVFKALRAAVTPLRAKVEPAQRIPRDEFDRALADLRADADNDRATFTRPVILARAAALRTMAANRIEAAA